MLFKAPDMVMRKPSSSRRNRLRHVSSAVAALEFGILAPVMAILVIGVFDLSKAAILWEQVWSASRTISESATVLAIPDDQATQPAQLTGAQVNQALSAIFAEIPWLRAGIATGGETGTNAASTASAVLTSVNYAIPSGCTRKCTYEATVKWSKAYGYPGFVTNGSVLRPCSVLIQNAPTSRASIRTISTVQVSVLPLAGIDVPDAFLMADVKLTYKPFFFPFKITFAATSYMPVRSNVPKATDIWARLNDPVNDPANRNDAPAEICS